MSFIDCKSQECTKSELDLFTTPMTQTAIESGAWIEYNPISTISDGTPIEFYVTGTGTDYMDLANTQLYVKAQVINPDGTPIDNTQHVAPVNLLLHSLFNEVDVKLNDTLVSSTNNTYPYRAYIETLLSYGPSAKKSQLATFMYYKDVSGSMEESNPLDAAAANTGMKKRHALIANGRVVDLLGRLHTDLFFQDKYLPCDVGMRIRLVRSKHAFCLMSDAAQPGYKIKIHECKLFVRKVKISPSVFFAHEKALEISNAKYAIRRVICKSYTIAAGTHDNTQEALFSGQLPSRIVLACVDNDAFNGTYRKNPFNFKNFDITSVKIFLDGQSQSHIKAIEPNFGAHQTSVHEFLHGHEHAGKKRRTRYSTRRLSQRLLNIRL